MIRELGYILREPLGKPFAVLTGIGIGFLIVHMVIS